MLIAYWKYSFLLWYIITSNEDDQGVCAALLSTQISKAIKEQERALGHHYKS